MSKTSFITEQKYILSSYYRNKYSYLKLVIKTRIFTSKQYTCNVIVTILISLLNIVSILIIDLYGYFVYVIMTYGFIFQEYPLLKNKIKILYCE
jgi:hypothetical protein